MGELKMNRQQGLSGPTWLLVIAIFALLISAVFAVYPMYYQNYKVKSVLESVKKDTTLDVKSKREIWRALTKRFNVQSIDSITRDNVEMSRKNGKTTVTINYEMRDDFIHNLFIGATFTETVVIDR